MRKKQKASTPPVGYVTGTYLRATYGLYPRDLLVARNNGLPYVKRGYGYIYKLSDIHAYYSGRIGNDITEGGET